MREVGEKFTMNGKTYVVTQVWGDNYGFTEVKDEPLPVFEETKAPEVVEEEAPKKRVGRRKKA